MLMVAKNIDYEEYMLDVYGRDDRALAHFQHWATLEELLEKAPGVKTVPQIWLDEKYVGGYTELKDLID
jgi:glutaredoxin